MATLGVKRAWIAKVDPKTFAVKTGINGINGDASDNDGKFLIDENTAMGVVSANLTNLQGSTTDIYGSNVLVAKSTAKSNPQTQLNVNHLPNDVKQRAIGNKSDGRGGYIMTGKSDSNNLIALVFETSDAFDIDEPVYFGFYGAVVTEPSLNVQTNNASEQRTTDNLTFSHVEKGQNGFGKMADSKAASFDKDKFFSDFFGNGTTSSTPLSGNTTK